MKNGAQCDHAVDLFIFLLCVQFSDLHIFLWHNNGQHKLTCRKG